MTHTPVKYTLKGLLFGLALLVSPTGHTTNNPLDDEALTHLRHYGNITRVMAGQEAEIQALETALQQRLGAVDGVTEEDLPTVMTLARDVLDQYADTVDVTANPALHLGAMLDTFVAFTADSPDSLAFFPSYVFSQFLMHATFYGRPVEEHDRLLRLIASVASTLTLEEEEEEEAAADIPMDGQDGNDHQHNPGMEEDVLEEVEVEEPDPDYNPGAHQMAATNLMADFSALFRGVPLSFAQGPVDGASEFETWFHLMAQAYQETATPFPAAFILHARSALRMGGNRPFTEETAGQLEALFERLEEQRAAMAFTAALEELQEDEAPSDGEDDPFGDGRGNNKRAKHSPRLGSGGGYPADVAR